MKAYIYSVLICLSVSCNLNAQADIVGHEKYNSYEQRIYIDNLDQRLIPEIFNDIYYFKFQKTEFKVDLQVIDTTHQTRNLYVYSKKAKDGYCFVNKIIMDKLKELSCDLNRLKVSYVYNGKVVSTKNEIKQILGLKERNIQISEISKNEKSGIISVYISDK